MQKGDITNRRNAFRTNNEDKGVYWVNKRLGLIRNLILIVSFIAFGIYIWYWFGNYGDKLKSPCQIAFEQEFVGEIDNVFLEKNSKGVVTIQLIEGIDTIEYFTGWGGHKKTGETIRKGYYLKKQANSFDLQVTEEKNTKEAIVLKATQKGCK
jgi:hypothetical protein